MVWTNDYSDTRPLHFPKRSIKTRIRKEAEKKEKDKIKQIKQLKQYF